MKPITIDGCACEVGRMFNTPQSHWVVREPFSGLLVGNPSRTRKEAIESARQRIAAFGGKTNFDYAVSEAKRNAP